MTSRAALGLLLALTLTAPAVAQGTIDDLLEGAPRGCDTSLEGEDSYTIYMGPTSIGEATISVSVDAEGRHYMLGLAMDMAAGGFEMHGVDELLLDASFAVVSRHSESNGTQGEERKSLTLEGGQWVRLVDEAEGSRRQTAPVDGPNYSEEMGLVLLLRAAGIRPGTYQVPQIDWSGEGDTGTPAEARVEVSEEGDFEHNGEAVRGHEVRIHNPTGKIYGHLIDTEGQLLELWFEGEDAPPMRMVRGGAQTEGGSHAADSPEGAVEVFFRVISGERPVDALDEVIDWAAVHAEMAEQNAQVAALSVDQVAQIFKDQFAGRVESGQHPSSAEIDALALSISAEVDGDQARVGMPGKDDAFLLERQDGTWRIVHMPR
jgi:hypothetical protein